MPLRLTLKPGELILVNGALIRNGDRNSEIIVMTRCRLLRESEIIREEEVDTPCKQIWMTMQVLHLSEDQTEPQTLLFTQIKDLMSVMPSSAPFIAAMSKALEDGNTHKALKEVKRLVHHEREILDQKHGQSDVS